MKVLMTCPEIYVGVRAVAINGEALGLWKFISLEELKKEVLKDYDLVIFGAFVDKYLDLLPFCKKKAFCWTSSPGQVEMSGGGYVEIDFLNKIMVLLKEKKVDYVFIGSKELFECLKNDGIFWFPYPFSIRLLDRFIPDNPGFIPDSVGLFAPFHPRKNHFVQIHAFRLSNLKKAELVLHTNTKLKTFGNIVYTPWLPDEEYYKLIANMKITLQIFHCESFAYSAVESVMLGTIPIVSPCIQQNLDLPDQVRIKNPDSPVEISKKIDEIIELSPEAYASLIRECQKRVANIIVRNNKELKLLLERISKL